MNEAVTRYGPGSSAEKANIPAAFEAVPTEASARSTLAPGNGSPVSPSTTTPARLP